jgi:hypothetical protein
VPGISHCGTVTDDPAFDWNFEYRISNFSVTVTPGDTTVELGTPVVILARFDGRVPSEASLLFGAESSEPQKIALVKNLNDPVFGGIIQEVKSDLLYHIEYAGRRSRKQRTENRRQTF